MRILILNQYGPGDDAPTGKLFGEIAHDWISAGHECEFVTADRTYRNRQGFRWVWELRSLASMLWRGVSAKRMDLILAGSSPPCLLVVAALAAMWHGAVLVHWAMDLYPELGARLEGGVARACSGVLKGWMRAAYSRCRTVVTLDEDMVRVLDVYGVSAGVIRPWVCGVPCGLGNGFSAAGNGSGMGRVFRWMYSGNLGRAHEWRTLLEAQALLEARGVEAELVFQGGGASWQPAGEHAARLGLHRCHWLPYVPEGKLVSQLLESDCLVATQLSETRGCLWPSKLALFLGLPRPLLWVGPSGGSVARILEGRDGAGCYACGDAKGVADWIEKRVALGSWVAPVFDLAEERRRSLEDWRGILSRNNGGEA
jgi:colanic acid biosynthesis glycosyl transferase WcaI